MNDARSPLVNGAILGITLALILASHEVNRVAGWSLFGVYIYWFVRIGLAYLIIVGAYAALGQVMIDRSSPVAHAGLAIALSYPPFVMVVTMLDLIIGDRALLQTDPDALVARLGLEAASLIDNHLTTGALLLAPYVRAVVRKRSVPVETGVLIAPAEPAASVSTAGVDDAGVQSPASATESEDGMSAIETPGLFLSSQPPVAGELLAAEAQEHYVKLKATEQDGMALYRFSDAVRDLRRYQGMQVHRSHWVADNAVVAVIGKKGSLKLELSSGEIIPVSRRYELDAEARYSDRERRS